MKSFFQKLVEALLFPLKLVGAFIEGWNDAGNGELNFYGKFIVAAMIAGITIPIAFWIFT